jgi:hypothetical protein
MPSTKTKQKPIQTKPKQSKPNHYSPPWSYDGLSLLQYRYCYAILIIQKNGMLTSPVTGSLYPVFEHLYLIYTF